MAKKIKLKKFTDKRGSLTVLDKEIKCKVERTYLIYNAGKERGGHRHKKNIQAMIAVQGSCKIFVNDGKNKKYFILSNKNDCLILKPNDWHVMNSFSKNCILLVLCSEKYHKNDYINEPYDN